MSDDVERVRRGLLELLPRWMVWHGEHTQSWWALPLWPEACRELIEALTPVELIERAREVERRYPRRGWGA